MMHVHIGFFIVFFYTIVGEYIKVFNIPTITKKLRTKFMSLQKSALINCNHCNHEQEINLYSSVNVTLDPDLKDKVIRKNLNVKRCEHCDQTINVVSGFLYHDMQNKLLLALNTSEEETEDNNNPFLQQEGYIYREVNSYNELLQKINIFTHRLNDTIVEEIASDLKTTLDETVPGKKFNVYFREVKKGLFKKKLIFECFSGPGPMMQLKYSFRKIGKEQMKLLGNIDMLRN